MVSPECTGTTVPCHYREHIMMAAFNEKNAKTYPFEDDNEAVTGGAGIPAHAATVPRWMPMNFRSCRELGA